MSAEIVVLPVVRVERCDNPGNGAYEVLHGHFGNTAHVEYFLAWLAMHGFIIAPLPDDMG